MIWAKAWRDAWGKVAGLALLLELNLVVSILFYPDFIESFGAIAKLGIVQIPVLKNLVELTGTTGFDGYFLMQHCFKAINVMGSVGAVLLGMGVVASEVENRTIELALSRPVSRSAVLLSRFAVSAVLLVLGVLLVSWSALPLSEHLIGDTLAERGESLPMATAMLSGLHGSLFLVMLFAATVCMSVFADTQAKVAFTAAGAFVSMFLVYFVQDIHDWSIYKWNDLIVVLEIRDTGSLPWTTVGWIVAVTSSLLLISLRRFHTRDF